jgi:hypothetical protein
MENMSMIILGEVRSKILCLEVDEKVVIPGIIRRDVEEVFIGEVCINR